MRHTCSARDDSARVCVYLSLMDHFSGDESLADALAVNRREESTVRDKRCDLCDIMKATACSLIHTIAQILESQGSRVIRTTNQNENGTDKACERWRINGSVCVRLCVSESLDAHTCAGHETHKQMSCTRAAVMVTLWTLTLTPAGDRQSRSLRVTESLLGRRSSLERVSHEAQSGAETAARVPSSTRLTLLSHVSLPRGLRPLTLSRSTDRCHMAPPSGFIAGM